MDNPERNHLR